MEKISATIEFNTITNVTNDYDEPTEFISGITGKIKTLSESFRDITIGKVELIYCDLEKADENSYSAFTVMDSYSQTTCDFYFNLFDIHTDLPKDNILEALGYRDGLCFNSNLLIIDRIEILPKYRGKGLSKSVIEQSIRMFGNKTFAVALKSFPLQLEPQEVRERESSKMWNKRMGYNKFAEDNKLSESILKIIISE